MTDDETGLQRVEQLESALKRELSSRAEVHRAWLETQLAPLTAEADQVQRELEEAAERRTKQHHELKDSNREMVRERSEFDFEVERPRGRDAWFAVAIFFGLTASVLFGSAQQLPPDSEFLPFVALGDFLLVLFGFLALTPLWSPEPKPSVRMPQRPTLPKVIEASLELEGGSWRQRLENAQSRLMKLTTGEQAPERSDYLQQLLTQARAELQRFISEGRTYLANTQLDHLGWQGVAWPEWMGLLRKLGLAIVPGTLVCFAALFEGTGFLHGAIALAGGFAAGFFRRSSLSFVEPPEPTEPD